LAQAATGSAHQTSVLNVVEDVKGSLDAFARGYGAFIFEHRTNNAAAPSRISAARERAIINHPSTLLARRAGRRRFHLALTLEWPRLLLNANIINHCWQPA